MLAPAVLYYASELLHDVFVEMNLGVIFFLLCLGAAGWFLFPSKEESLEREHAELQRFGHVVPTTPADSFFLRVSAMVFPQGVSVWSKI
ncbi:unnamed protein product [Microthlaspi erraticum]|uniref:Uncharacterized protein n=1 Tax=Microthlaspi erraticum TaxID=1685480 RepID=A0A6D2KFM0_9BRAS|nr:unnamed protein product [Microthlaspi erraticum]